MSDRSGARRVLIQSQPFLDPAWEPRQPGLWPCKWLWHPDGEEHSVPTVVAYRLAFEVEEPQVIRIHVSADERYELFLNGVCIGRGPERGDVENWFFETYDIDLSSGSNMFVARVYSLGDKAAMAQMSLRHGFLLCPDAEDTLALLATGRAAWESKALPGFSWRSPLGAWGTGWKPVMEGALYDWDHETGSSEGWKPAIQGTYGDSSIGVRSGCFHAFKSYHRLRPALLPPMVERPIPSGRIRSITSFDGRPVGTTPVRPTDCSMDESLSWEGLVAGTGELHIPPFTCRRVVIDLCDYYCTRTSLRLSGGKGAEIAISWFEAAIEDLDGPDAQKNHRWYKGNRDELFDKYLICPWTREDGPCDTFRPDGSQNRSYGTFWWQAGRYVQIVIETKGDALVFDSLIFTETRYPLEMEGAFECSLPQVERIIPMLVRGLQMCAHETYMDCPYYEQLMYIGDTRLQALATYLLTKDDALPKKTLLLFDAARLSSGIIPSRYPARVRQVISPFSLWWVSMCHDYALWRGEDEFVKSLLPGMRAVCDSFCNHLNDDGLLVSPNGWNFTDWVKEWRSGVPPGGDGGISSILNWQLAGALRQASELETWYGEPELANLQMRRARNLADATHASFWDEGRGLYADDQPHMNWSEHAQALALISGLVPPGDVDILGESLLRVPDLTPATIYFSHYLFEAYRIIGAPDAFLSRLDLWEKLSANGLKTPVESPEPTRSDCHAWGAHPLIHFYTILAGIRPVAPQFSKVEIHPQSSQIGFLKARLPHPRGEIVVLVERGNLTRVELPDGVKCETPLMSRSETKSVLFQPALAG